MKQLRQAGFKGTFMSGDGSEDPAFVKAAGAQAAERRDPDGSRRSGSGRLQHQVQGREQQRRGLYSTQSFDATNIFLAALDAGKTDAAGINDFIGSYTGTGVSGPIAFDKFGDIKESVIFAYVVKDGELDTANPTPIS